MGIPLETRSPSYTYTILDSRTRYSNVHVQSHATNAWTIRLPLSEKRTIIYDQGQAQARWVQPNAVSLEDMHGELQRQNPEVDVRADVCPTMLAFIYSLGEFDDVCPTENVMSIDVSDIRVSMALYNRRA